MNALQSGVHTRLARSGPSSRYQRLCTNAWTRAGGSILGRERSPSGDVRIYADERVYDSLSTANALQSGVHTRLARSGPSSRYQRLCTNAWTRAGGSILGRDRCSSGGVRISADVPNPITFHKVYVDVHNDAALSSGNELDAHKPCTSNCDRYPTLTCTPRARLKSRVTSARTCDV